MNYGEMMMQSYPPKKLLSIVTPTYNRGEYLVNCYNSLCRQTDPDFEWIIIDDGSIDNTKQIVSEFCRKSPQMRIQYIYKENGGKHTALNASHPYISGDYVLVLDSDDTLVDTAVEDIYRGWSEHDEKDIGIVIFLKGDSPNEPHSFAKQEHIPLDMYHQHTIRLVISDCCDVYRAEPFKQCEYPVFEGERFLSESILWNDMAPHYKIVYINKVIYILKFLDDGLTKSGRSMRICVPRGAMYAASRYMDPNYPTKLRIKNGLLYNCYGFFAKKTLREVRSGTKSKALMWLTRPGGWLLYLIWKKKYGGKNN